MAGEVFMACALGGGVGALVALQMWQPLWWVGMLVGGLIGYLTYEVGEVYRAVSLAWRETIRWRPNKERWGLFFRLLPTTIFGLPATIISPCFLLVPVSPVPLVSAFLLLTCTILLGVVFAYVAAYAATAGTDDLILFRKDFRRLNVFRIYLLVVPRVVGKGVWLAVTRGPGWVVVGIVAIARFLWQVFILIHSEMRLLCGLDAAIGAAIGYWLGNAGIGALAGGIFGLANFEIISKWWLKLVPVKAK